MFNIHINLSKRGLINYLLLPLSLIFYILSVIRRKLYIFNVLTSYKATKPLIVIGNITVGGTGKTQVVIELVNFLQQQGKSLGVVSRGYGRASNKLVIVSAKTNVADCGDEPKLIYTKTKCMVVVSSSKVNAIKILEKKVDIIVSDDGLQHYQMQRDLEVIVFSDLANGFYLPAGGLREGKNRLQEADFVLTDDDLSINPVCFVNAKTKVKQPLDYFNDKTCMALCGIANPQRFFQTLTKLKLNFKSKVFPDHYFFKKSDLTYPDPVITTEKDFVRYQEFATDNMWYLIITTKINPNFYNYITEFVNN